VEAQSCDEVVLALSLVLALAYDPDAMGAPAAPPPPAPAPPIVIQQPYLLPPPPIAVPPIPPRPAPSWQAGAGLGALAMSGIAPALRPVLAPFVEVGRSRDAGGARVGLSLLVEVPDAEVRVDTPAGARSASLGFMAARLEACPLSVALGSSVDVTPCAAFELGKVSGAGGSDVVPQRSGSSWWVAPVLLASLRWNPLGPLFVQVSLGGGLSLNREKFVLHEPDQVPVHTVPLGFAEVGGALGVHFP